MDKNCVARNGCSSLLLARDLSRWSCLDVKNDVFATFHPLIWIYRGHRSRAVPVRRGYIYETGAWNESGWQWLNGVEHTDDAVDGCGHDYYHEIVVFLFDVLCASVSMQPTCTDTQDYAKSQCTI